VKNLQQIFDTIASKEHSMNVQKTTYRVLEATLLMVVVSFYQLEPKAPPISLNVLLVNVTETFIVLYLQLLLSCLHLMPSSTVEPIKGDGRDGAEEGTSNSNK
jgi:hypothetical protein